MSVSQRIHLILPAFNEAANLGPLFRSFSQLDNLDLFRFYLINDGSTDNTTEIVEQIDEVIGPEEDNEDPEEEAEEFEEESDEEPEEEE